MAPKSKVSSRLRTVHKGNHQPRYVRTPALEFIEALARHQAWLDQKTDPGEQIDPSLLTSIK